MTDGSEKFGGRQVIGAETEVLGGVFPSQRSGAVVVDFEENPGLYEAAYRRAERTLLEAGSREPLTIGRIVNVVVKDMMPYDEQAKREILRDEADSRGLDRLGPEDEIGLSRFIGGGVCIHQTLFGASLLSLLQERQGIGGTISIEEEPVEMAPPSRQHIWTRYSRDGERIVIDSALERMSMFRLERPISEDDRRYLRPEELLEFVDYDDLAPVDLVRILNGGLEDGLPGDSVALAA